MPPLPNRLLPGLGGERGRQISVTRKDSAGTQIGQTTNAFDPHGRQLTVTDTRNGATTYAYDDADR